MLDALIAEIGPTGAEAIPLFGYPGAVAVQQLLKGDDGQPRADVVLGSNFNFSDFNASELLRQVGVPVINLITLYGRSEAEWRASPTGLSTFEGTFNVAVPEFAGTVAPTVVGSKEKIRGTRPRGCPPSSRGRSRARSRRPCSVPSSSRPCATSRMPTSTSR